MALWPERRRRRGARPRSQGERITSGSTLTRDGDFSSWYRSASGSQTCVALLATEKGARPSPNESLRLSHAGGLSGVTACPGGAEFPTGATPICLIQERHVEAVDQVFAALDRELGLPRWPRVEWMGHRVSMPACARRFRAASHRQRRRHPQRVLAAMQSRHDHYASRCRFRLSPRA